MKFKTLISILIFLIPKSGIAQISSEQQRILKYWYYRERLKTQFVMGLGQGDGESMPFEERNNATFVPGTQKVHNSDATIALSYYIIVLALEYELLQKNSQDKWKTELELFYAIDAINRVDRNAEGYYGKSPKLDGYYIRDDVCMGCDFRTPQSPNSIATANCNKLNARSVNSNISKITTSGEYCSGSIPHQGKNDSYEGNFTSMDQNIHLYLAMHIIIKRFSSLDITELPSPYNTLRFSDNNSNTNFAEAAKEIMIRLIDYMHKKSDDNGYAKWIIRDPDGHKIHLNWGGDAWLMAPGFSGAVKKDCGHNNPTLFKKIVDSQWHVALAAHLEVFKHPWYFYRFSDGLKFMNLMTANGPGNYYGTYSYVIRSNHYSGNYKSSFFKFPMIQVPLLNKLLYNIPDMHSKDYYRDLLDEAPCFGPYNYSDNCNSVLYPSTNWSTNSLIIHPESRGKCNPGFPGDYNGLDYMLLFNLFYLTRSEPEKLYFDDLYNHHVISDFPTGVYYGSQGDPADIISHNTITANNHIALNGDVEYRAGTSIELTTNFTVDANARFYAHIDDVACIGNADEFERQSLQNVNSVKNDISKGKINPVAFDAEIFPVPFNDNFNLRIGIETKSKINATLTEMNGKLIRTLFDATLDQRDIFLSFPTSDLKRGFYLVTLTVNGVSKTFKLIKSN
ncbi:MAG: T9SS type A sorting domain-containing protein [Bacteroidetes bacterium]|nr:T9SS type A sorting domain-containing protein [Bacteroidota bacterium]MBK9670986.1 T9SS type A sorting domain-containing protein [Bacteroidota bacterium]MBK9798310.1 T9SS type A sorting domain-containing protein [Bacteroidota bacterium]MBP6413944.1 T9SS type A sorting domain-containing protein [Bacteroidia bacterium]